MKRNNAFWLLIATFLSVTPAAGPVMAQSADPGRAPNLVGHWRNTRIVFESPRDEHLVLRANGSAEKWTVTASSKSATVKGTWSTEVKTLKIDWEDGEKWSRPFTMHEGQLVFPNVQGQRKFWDRIE